METVIRTKVKDLLKSEPGKEVLAKGWVRTKRGNKNVAFIALNDGSTINNTSSEAPQNHHLIKFQYLQKNRAITTLKY